MFEYLGFHKNYCDVEISFIIAPCHARLKTLPDSSDAQYLQSFSVPAEITPSENRVNREQNAYTYHGEVVISVIKIQKHDYDKHINHDIGDTRL